MLRTIAVALALAAVAPADEWRYVVPKAGDPFAHPSPTAVALSAARPADLKVTARFRGAKQRYARLNYGVGRTAPVTLVVDEVAPGDVDLYLDTARTNTISNESRVAGEKLTWRAPLKAVVQAGDEVKEYARTLHVRYNRVSRTLAVATCGYVEGTVKLDGKSLRIRRTDGDANGLFADAQDRVWIDLDGDGVWDAAGEEFLFGPIFRLGEKRFAVRADAVGKKLALAPLLGEGTLKLALPASIKPATVRDVSATFQSKDGTVATVKQAGGEVVVPVGDYRISSLLLTLDNEHGGEPWSYVFGDTNGRPPRWHAVAKGAKVALDAVGKLDFTAGAEKTCKPGADLSVGPRLHTGDGLLITRAYRGAAGPANDYGCAASVTLVDKAGKVLANARSGFA